MRRTASSRHWVQGALVAATALALVGAGSAKKKRREPPPPKVEETVADLADIRSMGETKLEGVGLVVGLDGTGADPPNSYYREKLVNDMRKAGVEGPDKLLADPHVSMVIVRVRVPTGTSTSDRIDAEVEVPPACGTKSLAGGYLLQTRVREVLIAKGAAKEGSDMAITQGPVMLGSESRPNDPKFGRVLGGTRVKKEVPFNLEIKEERRSIRTAAVLQGVINQRFTQREGVDTKGVATAKTDQYLVLKVPRVYHNNQPRYFQVVKALPMVDSPALRAQRLEAWGKALLDPKKAGLAALRLEGLGVTAVEPLKAGLASPNEQVRFFAAEALAYLGDASGTEVLAQIVVRRPEFRTWALAALGSIDEPAAHLRLRKLMDEADVGVRYGAFNALRTLDETDAFLGRVRVLDDPRAEAEEGTDPLALALNERSSRARPDDPFALYIVDCDGPPLIHVARNRRTEIVVFGRGQKMLTPVVLGKGSILLNASDGDETLQISKIVPSRFGDADRKVASSLEIGDVVRRTANLGASYPEVVEILEAAFRQKNLPGPLVVDAVPAASPVYSQAQLAGLDATAKKDDAVKQTKLDESKKGNSLRERIRRRLAR